MQIKRGMEQQRKTFIPKNGELLFTTDEKKIFVGDGETAGGVLVTPIVKEWELKSVTSQKYYFFPEDNRLPEDNNGVYLVFYSSVKLSKIDYNINNSENSITLNFVPSESNVEISIIYVGY